MGPRGYVTLIMRREEEFVFSGEQLALVFQLQQEESNAAEGQTITIIYNHYDIKTSNIFYLFIYFSNQRRKEHDLTLLFQSVQLPVSVKDNGCIILMC